MTIPRFELTKNAETLVTALHKAEGLNKDWSYSIDCLNNEPLPSKNGALVRFPKKPCSCTVVLRPGRFFCVPETICILLLDDGLRQGLPILVCRFSGVDNEERIMDISLQVPSKPAIPEKEFERLSAATLDLAAMARLALSAMQAPGLFEQRKSVSAKDRNKHEVKTLKKLGIVSSKTTVLDIQCASQSQCEIPTGRRMPKHFRRGHWVRQFDQAGKETGRFWRSECWPGDIRYGLRLGGYVLTEDRVRSGGLNGDLVG